LNLDEAALPPRATLTFSKVGLQSRPATILLALEHDEAHADKKSKSMANGMPSEFVSLKMNTCCIHASGAILLDEGQRFTLDNDLNACDEVDQPVHIPIDVDRSKMSPSPAMDFAMDDRMDDSDDDRGDEFAPDYNDDDTMSVKESAENKAANGSIFFPATPQTPFTPQTPRTAAGNLLPDPWRQLDPYEANASSARPFRRGKTFRTLEEVNAASAPTTEKKSSLRSSLFSCFAEAYTNEHKRRQALFGTRPAAAGRQSYVGTPSISWDFGVQIEGQEQADMGGEARDDDDDDDDDDDGGDFGGFDDLPESEMPMTAEDAPMGYEDLCREHVDKFFQASNSYINQSDLSKRVSDWQDRMAPVLNEQDQRPTFDIHIYGEHILDQFDKIGREVDGDAVEGKKPVGISFREVVSETSQYEVCRTFLASLQLAADGNVDIVSGAPQGQIASDIQLTCVNTEARRPTKIMDKAGPTKTKGKVRGVGFAVGSPMVCETYGADEYDRAYAKMPSPAPAAASPLFQAEVEEVPADPQPPPSPIIVNAQKKARRAGRKDVGSKTGVDAEVVPFRARTNT